MTSTQFEWIDRLQDDLPRFLQTLAVSDQPGRFLPCVKGATGVGRQAALGFSCLALKLYHMLGYWQPYQQKEAWLSFLTSYQQANYPKSGEIGQNAFIDPPVVGYLAGQDSWRQYLGQILRSQFLTPLQKVIIGETKQAIATLAELGEVSPRPYRGFPMTPGAVERHVNHLNWGNAWDAGGQAAALVLFLVTQAPRLLDDDEVRQLLDVCVRFFETLVDPETGTYFRRDIPRYDRLINGAMKILTALDWLERPIHYPEKLIDTCLAALPPSEGCHLVDVVYVLYRCTRQTEHNITNVQRYCSQVLAMIRKHHNADGGFSYHIGRSQTAYYGVPIAQGLAESDIHGTCLLVWAVAMILRILDRNQPGWKVIRP